MATEGWAPRKPSDASREAGLMGRALSLELGDLDANHSFSQFGALRKSISISQS